MDKFIPSDALTFDLAHQGTLAALETRIRTVLGSHRKRQEDNKVKLSKVKYSFILRNATRQKLIASLLFHRKRKVLITMTSYKHSTSFTFLDKT